MASPMPRLAPETNATLPSRSKSWVLDTKWKRLDSELGRKNYGLSQTDFYQLFAYGQKYLNGQGDLVLIYPKRASFQEALPVFEFSEGLRLWVVPFDIETGCLISGVLHLQVFS